MDQEVNSDLLQYPGHQMLKTRIRFQMWAKEKIMMVIGSSRVKMVKLIN